MKIFIVTLLMLFFTACSGESISSAIIADSLLEPEKQDSPSRETMDAPEISTCQKTLYLDQLQPISFNIQCDPANKSQIEQVELGNSKKELFLSKCYSETNQSCWCDQLIRPNPQSIDIFHCTYGDNQIHQLINPDESTWSVGIEAVKIVEDLEQENLKTEIIYNWWRPEPYNKNVGGSPTRHPHGTSVDIRLKTKEMQNLAFKKLCNMRKKGRVRAIGYYPTTAIHLGIDDNNGNTWGKSCP